MCQPYLSLGTSSYLVAGVGCIIFPYNKEEIRVTHDQMEI